MTAILPTSTNDAYSLLYMEKNKNTCVIKSKLLRCFLSRIISVGPECNQIHHLRREEREDFGCSPVAQRLKHLPAMRKTWFDPWVEKIPWRRKWQPTPVFLPGESHGWRSLMDYSPRGCKESDTTEQFHFSLHYEKQNVVWPQGQRLE